MAGQGDSDTVYLYSITGQGIALYWMSGLLSDR